MALISFAVTAKLICVIVFAYAKSQFSHNAAHISLTNSTADTCLCFSHMQKVCFLMVWPKQSFLFFVCVEVNVSVNKVSVTSGWSHSFLGITSTFWGAKCLAQGHNIAEVGFEPPTSRSRVRCSTTEPPHSPKTKSILAL